MEEIEKLRMENEILKEKLSFCESFVLRNNSTVIGKFFLASLYILEKNLKKKKLNKEKTLL